MSDQNTLKLKVIGERTIHCSGCERTVEFTLSRLPGVQEVRAEHETQLVEIRLANDKIDLDEIKAELEWIGYQVEPV